MSDQASKPKVALVYDFDGTLAPGAMQEHSLIPELGTNGDEFWGKVKELKREHNADEIAVYMWQMLERAQERNIAVTEEMLARHGRGVTFFPGVEGWFDRMRALGQEEGLEVEHYIISSGIEEMIRGCAIYRHFKHVFASKFIYVDGSARWPGAVINYTNKTQHLFRINKGVLNLHDDDAVNHWVEPDKRPIPFKRMIFVGDGDTDIPAMKMVRYQGGYSIAVYEPSKEKSTERLARLISEDRVSYVAPADYSEGGQLDLVVRGILGRMARKSVG